MNWTDLTILISVLVAIVTIAPVMYLYLKDKQRHISFLCKKSKFLSNKMIDNFINSGDYYPFNDFLTKIIICVLTFIGINFLLIDSIIQNWITNNLIVGLLVTFYIIMCSLCIGIGYFETKCYKKYNKKITGINLNSDNFKRFISSLLTYELNSKNLNNLLTKLKNKDYIEQKNCVVDSLLLLQKLIIFTNYKKYYFLNQKDEDTKSKLINDINSFYSSII